MNLITFLKNAFLTPRQETTEELSDSDVLNIKFKIVVVEFAENVENSSGEILAALLRSVPYFSVTYFDEPFNKNFLNLEGRTFFDFIDKGQTILDRTQADVVIWGHRENDKVRLNFQNTTQYNKENLGLVSLLDSLYLPASLFDRAEAFPLPVLNLILGSIISCIPTYNKQDEVKQKYLLKKIIKQLSDNNSSKNMDLEFLPYIMNFLALTYLSYCYKANNDKEFKIVNKLLETAIQHQDLIKNPLHLGCIYNHLGQLYSSALETLNSNSNKYFKGAISNYQRAQKYLGKYVYPYDYGFISYKLSNILYSFWKQTEDIQALRDSVFNLREAEKIFTYNLFPEFWADIEGDLGHRLNILSTLTQNNAIAELAINAYKNKQKIITEKRDPFSWAEIQENIGNIYYRLGRETDDSDLLEESLEYFHDALYIFENMEIGDNVKRVTISIAKTSELLG